MEDIEKRIKQIERIRKAFNDTTSSLRASTKVLFEDNLEMRDEVMKKVGEAWQLFFEYAKEKGYWQEFADDYNEKMRAYLNDECHQSDDMGTWRNRWGDKWELNPITGLIEQCAWGL